jgi:xylulokinase
MMGATWLGIDLGTQGVRAALIAEDGTPLGAGAVDFASRDGSPGMMTHDPDRDWTEGTVAAIRAAIGDADPGRIAGIGACGLFPAIALLDVDGRAVAPALLYGDTRAGAHVAETGRRLGLTLSGDEVSPKLLWLREEQPELLDRAVSAIGPTGFVVRLLTGTTTIDPQSAFRWGGLVDGTRRTWDAGALEELGIRVDLMPQIRDPGSEAGVVSDSAAALTGLRPGTPVVVGTTDSLATFIGHGAVRAGDVLIYYGSSGTLMACTTDLETVLRDPSLIGDGVPWRLAAYALDSGRLLEHLRTTMFGGRPYAELDNEADTVAPGSDGVVVIPHVQGRFDGRRLLPSTGAIVGFGLADGAPQLWRAALEAFGHVVADGRERIPDRLGRVVAAGGGARSATWRHIVGEISGLDQRYDPRGSAALGAAFLAAFGLGGVACLDPVAEGWLHDDGGRLAPTSLGETRTYAAERVAWHIVEAAGSAVSVGALE